MSRIPARIRKAAGDDILVRAGRTMTPTPRAPALREETRELVRYATATSTPSIVRPTRNAIPTLTAHANPEPTNPAEPPVTAESCFRAAHVPAAAADRVAGVAVLMA
jgi:hypothetical protein